MYIKLFLNIIPEKLYPLSCKRATAVYKDPPDDSARRKKAGLKRYVTAAFTALLYLLKLNVRHIWRINHQKLLAVF